MITAFSASANGLIVTVSFTFTAQADRGPFTCSVRRSGGGGGTDEFPCNIGQVSRTYDYDYCCGSEIYVIATDRNGVRSDQWDGWVDFPRPPLPTYSNLEAWHDGTSVFVQFYVTAAPGDDPKCDVSISEFTRTPDPGVQYREYDQPCEGTYAVAFPGPPGSYFVTIVVSSDTHFNPPPPDPAQVVRVE